jgi:hypothetical protein
VLYAVLALVLAALGSLVVALSTSQTSLWAWSSVGLSVVAGLLLSVEQVRRRRARGPHAMGSPAAGESQAGAGEE